MDTEILYKYKNRNSDEINIGHLTLDKSIYKAYTDSYSTNRDDSLSKLPRRLFNCSLIARGDSECRAFLNDISNFSNDDKLRGLVQFLSKMEIITFSFSMY